MKSTNEQLRSRGHIDIEDTKAYDHFNKNELLVLIKSKEPYKRTIAIHLIAKKIC